MAGVTGNTDDELDYMSDEFLLKCQDVRPGLVSKSIARRNELSKKQNEADSKSRKKPIAVQAQEKRDEGLASAISEDNKGFALLQKMGYKPGTGIGKDRQGRTEPVPLEVKTGRSGLGKDSDVKRKREFREAFREKIKLAKAQKMETMQNDFRQRLSNKQSDKQILRDLGKSQKVCEELDSKNNIVEPEERFFWPERMNEANNEADDDEEEEEEEEEEELDVSEKLDILTDYLRTQYYYCVWCGTTYGDKEEIDNNCPGDTAEAHDSI